MKTRPAGPYSFGYSVGVCNGSTAAGCEETGRNGSVEVRWGQGIRELNFSGMPSSVSQRFMASSQPSASNSHIIRNSFGSHEQGDDTSPAWFRCSKGETCALSLNG